MFKVVKQLFFCFDCANEVSPDELTEDEIVEIRRTWEMFAKDLDTNGVRLFLRFFGAYRGYQNKFPKLKGKPLEELADCPFLKGHARVVMSVFADFIENLDDPVAVKTLMTSIVKKHTGRNVRMEHYDNLLSVLLDFLEVQLRQEFNEECRIAWEKARTLFSNMLKDAMENAQVSQTAVILDINPNDGLSESGSQHTGGPGDIRVDLLGSSFHNERRPSYRRMSFITYDAAGNQHEFTGYGQC